MDGLAKVGPEATDIRDDGSSSEESGNEGINGIQTRAGLGGEDQEEEGITAARKSKGRASEVTPARASSARGSGRPKQAPTPTNKRSSKGVTRASEDESEEEGMVRLEQGDDDEEVDQLEQDDDDEEDDPMARRRAASKKRSREKADRLLSHQR